MIEQRIGDVLDQLDLSYVVHQANLFHTFGSGIAYTIKCKFPEAYQADLLTVKGAYDKLGTYSIAKVSPTLSIINMYSQLGLGGSGRQTSYDAMHETLTKVERVLRDVPGVKVGIPYKLGCGLANGSWSVVKAIVSDVFERSPIQLVVCQRIQDI